MLDYSKFKDYGEYLDYCYEEQYNKVMAARKKEKRMKNRGNKAKRDKDSILADTKNLLKILHPIIQPMPKIERIEGAPVEMKNACYNIIRYFNQAKECQEVRQENIRRMFGEFGVLLAAFELCISYGLIKEHDRLAIAVQLERIEEGVRKWRNATRSPKSQDQQTVTGEEMMPAEAAGSYEG